MGQPAPGFSSPQGPGVPECRDSAEILIPAAVPCQEKGAHSQSALARGA